VNEDQGREIPSKSDHPRTPHKPPTSQTQVKHRWDLSPRQVQDLLRERVRVEPLPIGNVHRVARVDASYQGKSVCASVVLLEFPELQTIEQTHVEILVTYPYVPVLVSFREARASWLLWRNFLPDPARRAHFLAVEGCK